MDFRIHAFLRACFFKCLSQPSNPWQGPDLIVPSADLQQRSPDKPRLMLCKQVIIKSQKLSHTDEDKSVEEKALKEDTTGM